MRILGIETSCDETSAAIIEAQPGDTSVKLVSNVVATSLALHAQTGGIIPEMAAREQIKYILPVIHEALSLSSRGGTTRDPQTNSANNGISHSVRNDIPDIDAIAVTYGPGLIGSLLVGVETAKTLSILWNKPLIPINHLFGHIYANFINLCHCGLDPQSRCNNHIQDDIKFPALALLVSGGHTDLVLLKNHNDILWLGGTRDDAAGEAFDKIGRLLGLAYPAGPVIEQLAKNGNPKAYHFPRPLVGDGSFDFSFSGLKTAVLRGVENLELRMKNDESRTSEETIFSKDDKRIAGLRKNSFLSDREIADICRGTQDAIIDVLIKKTLHAAAAYNVQTILLSGGVAANQTLHDTFQKKIEDEQLGYSLYVPKRSLCTDNAAMIAAAAFFMGKETPWEEITADPELYFD